MCIGMSDADGYTLIRTNRLSYIFTRRDTNTQRANERERQRQRETERDRETQRDREKERRDNDNDNDNAFIEFRPSAQSQVGDKFLGTFKFV